MGTQNISIALDIESRKKFLRHLLHDIEAFEFMFKNGMIEKGITRIGAEQEFCLVNSHYKPSKIATEILEEINDPSFTTELARYNLEINLDPLVLEYDCFSRMEKILLEKIEKAKKVAAKFNEKVILTGILPSIDRQSVQINYLTPRPRYKALADVLRSLRGDDFELHITGVDELVITHTNILFEACNTSFQCHYQVDPDDFVDLYNWSQAIAGPVLSVCANSPLLLGKQLWAETRIPLFQQSIDTRGKEFHLRERQERVTFGNKWIKAPADVYKSDVARHTLLFLSDIERDSLEMLQNGEVPKLMALALHNGTVYKWNRPCFGVNNEDIAHIRIENRYLPSGPSVLDEIANFTFWVGLMKSMPDHYRKIWKRMKFDDAKENFHKAAMIGIQSGMVWGGEHVSARRLILETLLPMAESGLQKTGIKDADIDRYLSVIEKRATNYQTGSRWMVRSFRKLKEEMSREEAAVAITAIMHQRRESGKPVHEWQIATIDEAHNIKVNYDVMSNVMSTDIISVTEHDLADLVLKIMDWRNIHHLPVESSGKLLGMITKPKLEAYLFEQKNDDSVTAADVMEENPIFVHPEFSVEEAIKMMKKNLISCLPVVERGVLVGLFTMNDVAKIEQKKGNNFI